MTKKPLFSIVVICKNEAKTLPKLIESLKEFRARKGEICILDTGSTDGTPEIARKLGCKVKEDGEAYVFSISSAKAKAINDKFIVGGEIPIVKGKDKFFNYSEARNAATKMASNDIIFCYDADEINAHLNIDEINRRIKEGFTQFEYNFVFAKDQWGNEAVKFIQSKAYDRRVMCWTGIIHELLLPIRGKVPKRVFLDEGVYKLEHHQNQDTERHSYLKGLALDCFNNPDEDRQSHYFARELMWNGRLKSAIKEFERHIEMNKWPQERAQSAIFIGDCYGRLNNPEQQLLYYSRAFYIDSSRRESLIKASLFYRHNNNPQAANCYATAALEIPYNGFYANNMGDYTNVPHEILYWAKGWLGDISGAQKHILKALEYQPFNPTYLRDTKYYFEYQYPGIDGWMTWKELLFLYELGKKYETIAEIGSFMGRSTHAILSGNKTGKVFAIDTWEGSEDTRDDTHWIYKKDNIYESFIDNVGKFPNLVVIKSSGKKAARKFKNNSLDACFIDAEHTKLAVMEDIKTWLPKIKKGGILCGHDFSEGTWMSVCEGVREAIGEPDKVEGSIWIKYIN